MTVHATVGDRLSAEAAHLEATSIWDELRYGRDDFHNAYMRYMLDDLQAALDLARAATADLARRGESGLRSTMLGLEGWLLVLMGDDDAAALAADESRRLGAPDDAITQITWRAAAGVVFARRGATDEADRLTTEGVAIAADTDSFDIGSAWFARAQVLSILGRRDEAAEAARRAREVYVAKGFVNGIRRVETLILE